MRKRETVMRCIFRYSSRSFWEESCRFKALQLSSSSKTSNEFRAYNNNFVNQLVQTDECTSLKTFREPITCSLFYLPECSSADHFNLLVLLHVFWILNAPRHYRQHFLYPYRVLVGTKYSKWAGETDSDTRVMLPKMKFEFSYYPAYKKIVLRFC